MKESVYVEELFSTQKSHCGFSPVWFYWRGFFFSLEIFKKNVFAVFLIQRCQNREIFPAPSPRLPSRVRCFFFMFFLQENQNRSWLFLGHAGNFCSRIMGFTYAVVLVGIWLTNKKDFVYIGGLLRYATSRALLQEWSNWRYTGV